MLTIAHLTHPINSSHNEEGTGASVLQLPVLLQNHCLLFGLLMENLPDSDVEMF